MSSSISLRDSRTGIAPVCHFLTILIPDDLMHQIKCRFFLCEALDLLHLLPLKAPSKTPRGRPISSPELSSSAAVFLRFRPTQWVPTADSWHHPLPSPSRTSSYLSTFFFCSESSRASTTGARLRRRNFSHLPPSFQEEPARRPRHHLGRVTPHLVLPSPAQQGPSLSQPDRILFLVMDEHVQSTYRTHIKPWLYFFVSGFHSIYLSFAFPFNMK